MGRFDSPNGEIFAYPEGALWHIRNSYGWAWGEDDDWFRSHNRPMDEVAEKMLTGEWKPEPPRPAA